MVDDEDLLLTLGETVLSSYGYKVLTANNGASALDLFAADPGGIDLVITDLVMPGMGGREVMERMRRVKPDLRVLCTTGYTKPGSRDNGEFLMKPFASQDLLRKVKQLLAAEAGGD
jgi:two-component system cell cycle sensor histidine kinase/response regulator CckA